MRYGTTKRVRALQKTVKPLLHLARIGPVVQRPGFFGCLRADEGELFDSRDIIRRGTMVIAAGQFRLIQLDEDAAIDRFLRKCATLFHAAIAPENPVRFTQADGFLDEFKNVRVGCVAISKWFLGHNPTGRMHHAWSHGYPAPQRSFPFHC
jgi:hypothetical protein